MPDDGPLRDDDRLNSSQERRLVATCRYIDGLLSDAETILSASTSHSPFGKYIDDLTPAQRTLLSQYINRVRTQMLRALAAERVELPSPSIGALWAIRTGLQYVDVAIEELRPHYMKGYGPVAPGAARVLTGLVEELQTSIRQLENVILKSGDIAGRLERLADVGEEGRTLKLLHDIIDRYSLVEFQRPLGIVLDRLQDPRFEVAVFGRVSTGKSSLLDAVLDTTALPVGVNPITAVPTRIAYGREPRVIVSFADAASQTHSIEHVAEFATETENPGNRQHVTRLVVELPSTALEHGVVFVDTPGLGSLATSGAAETLAYLPRCDLGVVLVDATATLSSEDIATVRMLIEAGIAALVVVSKADLLSEADRSRVLEYVRRQLEQQLGAAVPVATVSSTLSHRALLDRWLDQELWPRLADHRAQVRASIRRKIGALREAVEHALRARLRRSEAGADRGVMESVERELRAASALFEDTRQQCERVVERMRTSGAAIVRQTATRAAESDTDVPTALRQTLETTAMEDADEVRRAVLSLAERLQVTLGSVAQQLELPPPSADVTNSAIFRELPRPDLAEIGDVHQSRVARLLGRRIGTYQLERELASAAGESVGLACSAYARLLSHWARKAMSELRTAFESDADAYRARVEREIEGGAEASASDVQADLEALSRTAA